MKVGFIGLGSMGGDQAMLLAQSEHDIKVFDVFPKAMEKFEGLATLAESIADVGKGVDVVGLCVRDDQQVNECVDQLLPVMTSGSVLLVHSTVHPDTMRTLTERAKEVGIVALDAAVTRTVMKPGVPFVCCMMGGDEAVVNQVRSVLDTFSTDVVYAGPNGAGMAMKIANNLVSWSEIMIALEAFELAEASGVSTASLISVMKKNGVMSPPMESFLQVRDVMDKPEMQELIRSQSGIGEKDLGLAEKVGKSAGVETQIGSYISTFIKDKLNRMAGE